MNTNHWNGSYFFIAGRRIRWSPAVFGKDRPAPQTLEFYLLDSLAARFVSLRTRCNTQVRSRLVRGLRRSETLDGCDRCCPPWLRAPAAWQIRVPSAAQTLR